MTDFKAAIFDLDGTLIDSMYVWEKVDRDFLTERGIEVTDEYTEAVRGMYFESAARYTIARYGFKESIEQIIQIWLNMARYEYENNVRLIDYKKKMISCPYPEGEMKYAGRIIYGVSKKEKDTVIVNGKKDLFNHMEVIKDVKYTEYE